MCAPSKNKQTVNKADFWLKTFKFSITKSLDII